MTTSLSCGALILAGGRGRRIGYDKKQLRLSEETVIDHLLALLQTEFSEVIVSSNTPFARPGVLVVGDTLGAGPLAGIYSALCVAKSDYLYVTACDMPFISRACVVALKEAVAAGGGFDAAVTRRADGFLEPFNALYAKTCIDKIRSLLTDGQYKMGMLLESLNLHITDNYDERVFFNINNAADLDRARSGTV
jgi:molybdopterin-guanine dinucleotide biosynthesis protein A